VARPVLTNEAGTVNSQENWLIVLASVVHDLIPRSLHEGGVDRHDWSTTTHRNSSCGGNRMLFRNPYIVEAIRVRLCESVEARPSWHASGNRNDAAVIGRGSNEFRCESGGVVRLLRCGGNGDRTRLPIRIRGNTNLNFWKCRSVESDRIRFRWPVAATLLRPRPFCVRTCTITGPGMLNALVNASSI